MANQQLVDYIKEQLGAGISKENLRQTLLGVGWTNQDIDEAFRAVDEGLKPKAEATPAPEPLKIPESNTVNLKEIAYKKEAKEVGDLSKVSTPPNFITQEDFARDGDLMFKMNINEKEQASKIEKKEALQTQPQVTQIKIETTDHSKKFKVILYVIVGLFVAGLLAIIGLLYNKNNQLEAQVNANLSQRSDLENQNQSLVQTINELQKQTLNLKEENTNLAQENEDLINQLLLFDSSTSSLDIVLNGTILYEKGGYLLKTNRNILVNIKNSKDEKLKLVLEKLVNSKVKVEGMRTPGLREITILKINNKTPQELLEELTPATSSPKTTSTSTTTSTSSNKTKESSELTTPTTLVTSTEQNSLPAQINE